MTSSESARPLAHADRDVRGSAGADVVPGNEQEGTRVESLEPRRGRGPLFFLGLGLVVGLVLGAASGPSLAERAWARELQRANGWTWTTASERMRDAPLLLAAVARGGVGELPASELLAYTAHLDEDGRPLTGDRPLELALALALDPDPDPVDEGGQGGVLPPAEALSVTVYLPDGTLAPAIAGPRTLHLTRDAFGAQSLAIRLVPDPPTALPVGASGSSEPSADELGGAAGVTGSGTTDGGRPWLAVPRGPYQLVLRLYRPGSEALRGSWQPPAVRALTR